MSSKYKILHISSDYPDQINKDKPKAVCTLIDNSKTFDHIIFSLNRYSLPQKNRISCIDSTYSVKYWGFPFGIGLKWFHRSLSKSIAKLIENHQLEFDIIHAHKLTFEGIVGYYLAQRFNKPLVCSVRGSTDINILKHKPTYRSFYRKIADRSRWLFFIAPWTKIKTTQQYKLNGHGSVLLPNIISNYDTEEFNTIKHSKRFVTAFRLDWYKAKNIKRLIKAFDCVVDELNGIHLDVIGGGSPQAIDKIKRMIKSANHADHIHLKGEMSNPDLCKSLPSYAALLLPSYPETFGMVFMEAIFAGLPIMFAKDTGVDGYFCEADFSARVDHKSISEMSVAIRKLYKNQLKYKKRIIEFMKNGGFNRFKRETIVSEYEQVILQSIN